MTEPDYALFLFALKLGSALAIGLVLGSFATMLAYRVPRGLSIVRPRSHCPSCNTPLGVRDLVPVGSYLLGKGRCRHCGVRIPPRYLFIELGVALIVTLLLLAVL